MRNVTKLIALILCAAMLLSMAGCAQEPVETTVPPTQPSTTVPAEPTAEDIYAAARAKLDSASHVALELLITKYTTVVGDEFSEQSTQTLTYQNIGTAEAMILMDESLEFSVHSEDYVPGSEENTVFSYQEIWSQGNIYAQLEDTYRYCAPMDAAAAAARYTPVVLLNAELYGSITAEYSADGTVITFAEPNAAESWAVPQDAELKEASGTARIGADGLLEQMTYTATYIYGTTEITLEVRSEPVKAPEQISAPADPDSYEAITSVDALRMSVTAPVMLMQADDVTTSALESMFCQAAGVLRNQSTVVNQSGRKDETKAKIETSVFFMNYSTNESERYSLEETFLDGELTVIEDDGEPVAQSDLTWEDIRVYTNEKILYGMLDMDYWQDVTVTDMGNVFFLEYTLNDYFGNTIQDSICSMLWNDPSFLINLSTKYENTEVNGYLSVDKFNGLPVAAGYYYEGSHTIEGRSYPLTLQFDQSIEAPAKGAYKQITGEMPQEEEPEAKATPLFYHVTGENGQEMWLLGTIHVGDERTAYLPEEIYNAFAASDALALECNTEAFDEQLEEDEELSDEVSSLYFYSGISLEAMMEEEEYAQAVKRLKSTGNYNMNMPYAKPYLWSSSIDLFYLRQGYQLHSDQGVEERLMDWAEALDKEIWEVESNMFQIEMLTGFSKDLQMLMLRESMETGAQESWESTMDLYEKWCAGDEAVLREELSDAVDMTDWTEEDIAEYEATKHLIEEYNKAMSYDRNEGMLNKAIAYMESGEVVFFAVGLAHLLNNENGLVDTLREAGYTVELVTYAE